MSSNTLFNRAFAGIDLSKYPQFKKKKTILLSGGYRPFTSKQYKEAQKYADAYWDVLEQGIKYPKMLSFLAVDICKQFEEDL